MSYQNYINPELGFELEYPVGWIVDENPGFPAIIFVAITEQMDKIFNEMVSCFVQPYHDHPNNFEEYSKNTAKKMVNTAQGFQIVEDLQKNRELGNQTYEITYKGYKKPFNVTIRSLWTLFNNKIYTLNFTADSTRYNEVAPIFDKIKGSFKMSSPTPVTADIEMQRKKDKMLGSIDFIQVENDVKAISKSTSIEKIKDLFEVFSLASIMADLKGFGPLNHLYPIFHQKLNKTGLIKKLPEDLKSTVKMFDDVAKCENLI